MYKGESILKRLKAHLKEDTHHDVNMENESQLKVYIRGGYDPSIKSWCQLDLQRLLPCKVGVVLKD